MSAFLKFVTPLLHPVGFGWLMLLVTAGVCWRRGRRLGAGVSGGTALAIWLAVQPAVTGPMLARAERRWAGSTIAEAPNADAVIVLGGGWRPSRYDYRGLDLTECGDRLTTGLELCRRGRAPVLVLGGDAPWTPAGVEPDSERVRGWAGDWGLGATEVVTLGPVLNTRDEAVRARELVERRGWKRVLLVTSAFHLGRAEATFREAGVPVHPVACDFRWIRVGEGEWGWRWFPDEESLFSLTLWWHEQLGWLAYRIIGRL
jgi:uncharacterized SAM-binding protein YcdF (DUF218 family)